MRFTNVIYLAGHRADDTRSPDTIQPHLLEHRCQLVKSSFLIQCIQELKYRLVRILFDKRGKVLHALPCNLGKLGWLLVHLHHQRLESRRRHLLLLHVLVKYRGISQNVTLSNLRLIRCPCHASSKSYQVCFCRTGVLCHLINGATGSQHRPTQPKFLVLTEHLCQLADVLHRIIPQILTQCHINLIGRIDKLQYILLPGNPQTTSITGQSIQLLTHCTGIYFLELFIQSLDFISGHTGVLDNLRFGFLHLRIFIHTFAGSQSYPGKSADNSCPHSRILVNPIRHFGKRKTGITCLHLHLSHPLSGQQIISP